MSQKVLLTSKRSQYHSTPFGSANEKHLDFKDTIFLVGFSQRNFSERLKRWKTEYNTPEIKLGYLDITFFRDDFHWTDKPLEANKTKINFIVEDKNVVFLMMFYLLAGVDQL
jgi:pyrimidine operon attenuation protein/uracil phosphoribosyltransferase